MNDAKILKNIPVQNIDNRSYRITLSAIPFKLDFKDELMFSMYDASTDNNGNVICQIETEYNDSPLKLYLPGYLSLVEG